MPTPDPIPSADADKPISQLPGSGPLPGAAFSLKSWRNIPASDRKLRGSRPVTGIVPGQESPPSRTPAPLAEKGKSRAVPDILVSLLGLTPLSNTDARAQEENEVSASLLGSALPSTQAPASEDPPFYRDNSQGWASAEIRREKFLKELEFHMPRSGDADASNAMDWARDRMMELLDLVDSSESIGRYYQQELLLRGRVHHELEYIQQENQRLGELSATLHKLRARLETDAAELHTREEHVMKREQEVGLSAASRPPPAGPLSVEDMVRRTYEATLRNESMQIATHDVLLTQGHRGATSNANEEILITAMNRVNAELVMSREATRAWMSAQGYANLRTTIWEDQVAHHRPGSSVAVPAELPDAAGHSSGEFMEVDTA